MTATNAGELVYRTFQESDLPALLELWEHDAGWGRVTPREWQSRYRETPYEPALVCVAVDSARAVAGQIVGLPCRLLVAGREVRALRLWAPILRRDVRMVSTGGQHPVVRLVDTIVAEAQRGGFAVLYSLPARSWSTFIRRALPAFVTTDYGCRSAQLADFAGPDRRRGMSAELSRWDDAAYESLWVEAARRLPFTCAVVRSAPWLRYKNGEHIVIDVRSGRNGSLAGYCAFRNRDGLLIDLLARDPGSIESVLAAALCFLAGSADDALERVTAMETPLLLPALSAVGFEPVDFRFGFTVRGIDESVRPEDLAPDGWWVTGATEMAAEIVYRLFEEPDRESVARLWEEETDWGTITPEMLRTWLDTPYGPGVMMLAVEDDGTTNGRVVGELMFFAFSVFVGGRTVAAVRPGSAVVSRRLLRRFAGGLPGRNEQSGRRAPTSRRERAADSLEHPIAMLYTRGLASARERGAALLYALPSPAVAHFFQLFPEARSGCFPLWSLDLTATDSPTLAPGLTLQRLARYDERADELWEASSKLHGCQVLRTADSLAYKARLRSSSAHLVEREGSPFALAAGCQDGDRQWLIYDLVVRDSEDSLRAALVASVAAAAEHGATRPPDATLRKVAVVATPTMEPVLEELGFTPDDYDFSLFVQVLDPQLDPASVAPERWYVSAND